MNAFWNSVVNDEMSEENFCGRSSCCVLRRYSQSNANNVAERVRKMSIRSSLFVHTHNVLSLSWDWISGGTRGPVTSVSVNLVILMEIISIKTYSHMHKKIVNTCSHSNITV